MTGVSGQVAVVTGGSRGIGLAAARALGVSRATLHRKLHRLGLIDLH